MKEENLPSVLLLPAPPDPASRATLNAAYRPSLHGAISQLKNRGDSDGSILLVALVTPILEGKFRRGKTLSWAKAQSLVAGVYSIVSVVCAQLQVATDVNGGKGSVDTRVVIIDDDAARRLPQDFRPAIEPNNTVLVDLGTFVSAYHPWNTVFSVDNEAGHQLLSRFMSIFEGRQVLKQEQMVLVEGGLTLNISGNASSPAEDGSKPHPTSSFDVVCLGGTFDHLHPGHKLLLTAAVLLLNVPKEKSPAPCRFIIGITGDQLLKNKKYAEYVQSWEDRALYVIKFLSSLLELREDGWRGSHTPNIQVKDGEVNALFRNDTISIQCVRIEDAYGPTITVEAMDALVVSGETRSGGAAVNEKRKALGWQTMEVFEVDVLDAEDIADESTKTENFASKISSTAIRKQKAEARI